MTDPMNSILFSPIDIGGLRLPGRVFKTATSETRASEDGYVTDELLQFYEPIAKAGTPMIITGNLYVSEAGKSTYRMCGADHADKIPGLTRWADLVHRYGSTLFGQINHCGRQVLPDAMGLESAVSASDVREKVMGTKPRPLSEQGISEVIRDFATSAEICQKAGFDGVQIHAGHGYLINQFLSPYTNRRQDQYGGSFDRRMRLLLDIYRAIRERVGDAYPLILKIGGADELPGRAGLRNEDLVEIARIMQGEGIDGVEITVGHYESGFPMIRGTFHDFFDSLIKEGIGYQLPFIQRTGLKLFKHPISWVFNRIWPHEEGFNIRYAREFKKRLDIPVICVGGFQTKEKAESALNDGLCDAISVGRSMIADPCLYTHFKEGVEGPVCNFCNGCIGRAGRLPVDCYEPEIRKVKDRLLGIA